MIERPRSFIALPLSNADRKRAYLLRLIASPLYDEHEHARRVAVGLRVLARLQAQWTRKAAPARRPLLTLKRTGT